ncbi:MAG: hypothetical protein IJO94_02210 [Firmicutes bacterium]|nr:hypothetical protein [Bacillota bacterium]
MFRASQNAVLLWASTIVPSMLPFFILNTLLHSAGGIELIGKCFRRPAEKILNLPGEAAFILATGYSTGVPVSASLVAELRKNNMLSREEGNRLLAFGANVSPAFLLSAVSISMLGAKELGPYLAAVHYGTNLGLTLLTCLFFRKKFTKTQALPKNSPLKRAPTEYLTEAIFQSIRTIFLIGGIILCFFILIAFFDTIGLIRMIAEIFDLSEPKQAMVQGLFCGILEITAGSSYLSAAEISDPQKTALISAILAFGGLSALFQIASVIRQTDLSLGFYLKYKIIQGVLAYTISLRLPFFTKETFAPIFSEVLAQTTPSASHIPIGMWCYGSIAFFGWMLIIYRRLCEKRKR